MPWILSPKRLLPSSWAAPELFALRYTRRRPKESGPPRDGQIAQGQGGDRSGDPGRAHAWLARRPRAGRCAAQTSRTQPRSQRCAGSASSRGCQSNETVISGMATGRGKLCIPARRLAGVPFGNAGDQVGGPGQSQRGRKAADDRDDLAAPARAASRLHRSVPCRDRAARRRMCRPAA